MPFRFKYDKPVLYDLADPTAAGAWDCNTTGNSVGVNCDPFGVSTGGTCISYGALAGATCNPGYQPSYSWCYSGTSNNPMCTTGAHAIPTCSAGTST